MILAIDAGNTNIVLGCLENGRICLTARIPTDRTRTGDEYASDFQNILGDIQTNHPVWEGAILSCVVPDITEALSRAAEAVVKKTPLAVGMGLKTGLKVKLAEPSQLGADLITAAVAALDKYPCPLMIFDIGTASTMSVIDSQGCFLGGAIMAGPGLSVDALAGGASQLSKISLEAPPQVICSDTTLCIRSGAVYGQAAMLDGLSDRVEEELGEPMAAVIGTGGLFGLIAPYCKRKMIREDNLMLDGLRILYERNKN